MRLLIMGVVVFLLAELGLGLGVASWLDIGAQPSRAQEAAPPERQEPHVGYTPVETEPLEQLIPCAMGEERKAYMLKARDGRSVQVVILCENGRLTAHTPLSDAEAR